MFFYDAMGVIFRKCNSCNKFNIKISSKFCNIFLGGEGGARQTISAHGLIYSSYAMWGIIEDLNIVMLPSHFHQHLCSLPSCVCDLNQCWLFCLGPFALLLTTTFKLFVFLFERTGWRFFHKLVVRAQFEIYICIRN
jgi:hypothetical protein